MCLPVRAIMTARPDVKCQMDFAILEESRKVGGRWSEGISGSDVDPDRQVVVSALLGRTKDIVPHEVSGVIEGPAAVPVASSHSAGE
jgi:hypothetical protein